MKGREKKIDEKQYDGFAREFRDADENFPDITRPYLYKFINHHTLRGTRVLDLGCGYGKDLAYFHERGCDVYGIDESREMLALARERVPCAHLRQGNFEELPYDTWNFDLVFSRYAIQHVRNSKAVFNEIDRVLMPRGVLLFLVTHPLRHYFEKKTKDYWTQEEIPSVILDSKLIVKEYSHTLKEYLDPKVFRNFDLEAFEEKSDPAAKKFEGFGEYPRVLIMKYRRKEPQLELGERLYRLFNGNIYPQPYSNIK